MRPDQVAGASQRTLITPPAREATGLTTPAQEATGHDHAAGASWRALTMGLREPPDPDRARAGPPGLIR